MATPSQDEKKPDSGGGVEELIEEAKDVKEDDVGKNGDTDEDNKEEESEVKEEEKDEDVEEESEKKSKNGKRDRKQQGKKKAEAKVDKEEEDEESETKKRKTSSPPAETEAVTPKVERPTRERKSVERYSNSSPASRPSSGKSLEIVKGSGTRLKDIPNVAYKLSKKKPDDNLQLLHLILFGKKAKVHNLKKDIGQFSGFVWADNEEKQRAKTKEKIDKCVKEKLMDFCDVLNIPINRSSVKKDDLSVRLLEFLESPQATTDVLLADKEQKGKKQKKKVTPAKSRSVKTSSGEKSAKKSQAGEKRKRISKADENVEADDKDDNMDSQSLSSEEDSVQKLESDQEIDSEEEETKEKMTTSKNSAKNHSEAKNGKKASNAKSSSEKAAKSPAKSAKKNSGTPKKSTASVEVSASSSKGKASLSKKKKVEEETQKEKPVPTEKKSPSKKQRSKSAEKSAIKDKGKGKAKKETKSEPTNEELRAQAVNILKEVDFNTATLSDILRLLGSHFGLDLMHRKTEVKAIITEIIENMSNDGDEDDEDEDTDDSGKE